MSQRRQIIESAFENRDRLKPGGGLRVRSRDELTETVQIEPEGGEPLQLGFRAAARVLVQKN